jgi:Fe-Mn family superoxide dismutase
VTPSGKLAVTATANQDNPIMNLDQQRGIPILAIDVWEHAYYLKHQNKRPAYMTAIWEVIDWAVVSKKYDEALQSELLKRIAKTPKSKK